MNCGIAVYDLLPPHEYLFCTVIRALYRENSTIRPKFTTAYFIRPRAVIRVSHLRKVERNAAM